MSKVIEFGDTLLIVLRKKELVLLQHYHHLITMCYCWYGTLHVYSINNTSVWFATVNYVVSAVASICLNSDAWFWLAGACIDVHLVCSICPGLPV